MSCCSVLDHNLIHNVVEVEQYKLIILCLKKTELNAIQNSSIKKHVRVTRLHFSEENVQTSIAAVSARNSPLCQQSIKQDRK